MRDSCGRAGEGSRIVEMGLEEGGVGKREYLVFLSSMVTESGESSGREGQSTDLGGGVERVGGQCKRDNGKVKLRCTLIYFGSAITHVCGADASIIEKMDRSQKWRRFNFVQLFVFAARKQ